MYCYNNMFMHLPSTCLISTYVCFLSIDILTVIISIEFIPFVLSLINQMKLNKLKDFSFDLWVDWWLIKEREQLLPSLKKFHFFKLRHKRLYVVGPAASLINSSINSFTSFINQTQSISSSLHWTAQPRKPKWNKLIRFVEWRCFRGERPPAYNPPNQKQKNFSSINQAKANH